MKSKMTPWASSFCTFRGISLFIWEAVTLKMGHGHQNWYERVKLDRNHRHAVYKISLTQHRRKHQFKTFFVKAGNASGTCLSIMFNIRSMMFNYVWLRINSMMRNYNRNFYLNWKEQFYLSNAAVTLKFVSVELVYFNKTVKLNGDYNHKETQFPRKHQESFCWVQK